jgi:hypothetical protein
MRGLQAGTPAVHIFFEHDRYKGRSVCVILMRYVFQGLLVSLNNFSRWLERNKMSEILIILAIFLVWFLLQSYILPKLGIST